MRTALITGASRGIGESIARKFAQNNIKVVLCAKTMEDKGEGSLLTVKEKIEYDFTNSHVEVEKLDVRDENQIKNVMDKYDVDILINNSGALFWNTIGNTSQKKYDLVQDVNVRGSFLLSHYMILSLLKRGEPGHIVFHSPPLPKCEEEYQAVVGKTAYMLSKWGMTLTSKGISEEYKKYGISSNTIWPRTCIETNATIKTGLGNAKDWRKPSIISDSIYEIINEDPHEFTGNELIDELYLKTKGITEFDKYQVVPGFEPKPMEEVFNAVKNSYFRL